MVVIVTEKPASFEALLQPIGRESRLAGSETLFRKGEECLDPRVRGRSELGAQVAHQLAQAIKRGKFVQDFIERFVAARFDMLRTLGTFALLPLLFTAPRIFFPANPVRLHRGCVDSNTDRDIARDQLETLNLGIAE